ncbi:hydroxyacyl-thioester dehydratase type 2, mitochondrial-like [Pristis pectinata]|uniref:hydroxyacyl-thioester dehydratase type 2, mitochondrial-like n=1 Tax=Pristis pectinata TaxID=685728 RepID=UPI00223D3148|nr:hydroxyacyl-thioester dehydratase type 2, mitochondrial-like [Pristis pectinata]
MFEMAFSRLGCKIFGRMSFSGSRIMLGIFQRTLKMDRWCAGGTVMLHDTFLRSVHVQAGERAELTRVFTQSDVFAFSALTGDTNPLHLSEDYAKAHRFEKPVVHGILVCGLISAVLATKIPGCILLSQELRFLAPLYAGEQVSAIADIIKIKRSIAWIAVSCIVNENKKIILKGEVKIMLPEDKGQNV